MAYVVACSKTEARVEFARGATFDSLDDAMTRMDYENKYGYFKEFEHFIYEVEMKVKAKKLI